MAVTETMTQPAEGGGVTETSEHFGEDDPRRFVYPPSAGKKRGRRISTESALGRYLTRHNYRAGMVAEAAGMSIRIMTEYLAARQQISTKHLLSLCRVLHCEPADILDEEDIPEGYEDEYTILTDAATTIPGIDTIPNIAHLKEQHKKNLSW